MPSRLSSSFLLSVLVAACGGAIDPEDSKSADQAINGHSSDEPGERTSDEADERAVEVTPPATQNSDQCAPDTEYAECTDAQGIAGVCECTDGVRSSVCGRLDESYSPCDPREQQHSCTLPNVGGSSSGGGVPTTEECLLLDGAWVLTQKCNTPLVLSFDESDDARVHFTHPQGSFDLVGAGASFETDWVSAATPWLALDRNGNGRIDDGAELFGSMTELGSRRAVNGFEALAALDDDHDGRITAADPAFAQLLLWSDADQDRVSSKSELRSLASRGLVAIELDYRVERRCTGSACEVERARFTFSEAGRARNGHVVDVHFAVTR